MSLHPSLKIDSAGTQVRSVLTRIERIKDLMKKDLWEEGRAVTGLPKTKIIRIKKVAKEEKEEEEVKEGETPSEEGEAKKEESSDK